MTNTMSIPQAAGTVPIRRSARRAPSRMNSGFKVALAAVTIAWAGATRATVIASSSFDSSSDGWLVDDLAYPSPGSPPPVFGTYTPTLNASGGNPGGHLSLLDVSENAWYWSAPSKFLGDKSAAYGGTLQFDLAITGKGYGSPPGFKQEDLILVGNGLTLVHDISPAFAPTPNVSWVRFTAGLGADAWKVGSLAGTNATAAQMQSALQSLSTLYIRGEYLFGLDDVGRIDNVVLSSVPEASSALMLAAGMVILTLAVGSRSRGPRRREGITASA